MPSQDKRTVAGHLQRQFGKLRLTRVHGLVLLPVLVLAALAMQWGFGKAGRDLVSMPLALALVWAALIDIERLQLPDMITWPLVAAGLGWAFESGAPSPESALIGAMSGYAVFVGISWAYRQRRGREGLGLGDAKLFAAAGAWLGWTALPFVALLASGAGLVFILARSHLHKVSRSSLPVAFGPFIAGGFWALWLLGK